MILLEVVFWLCLSCVFYTYLGYSLLVAGAAWARPWRGATLSQPSFEPIPVSVLVAAHDEEGRIGQHVRELAGQIARRPAGGELIVISDGSTDRTVEVAQVVAADVGSGTTASIPIRVLALPARNGKAVALNEGCAVATHPVLVFADVRQTWAPDAIDRLVANFADPSVGAVSGDLVIEAPPGVLSGVGQYWRFEKWLRRNESRFYSTVGVTGSICAVRRELFVPMPVGTILDDVHWPLQVAMGGARVVHDEKALALDRLPSCVRDEFRRKVRTLAGNFQLMTRMPAVLLPWRNPIWGQFWSHKLLRLVVPWALLGLAASSAVLAGPVYRAAFWAQLAFYGVALAGLRSPVAARFYLASVAGAFLVLNTAAWLAFWVWLQGRHIGSCAKSSMTTLCVPRDRLRPIPPRTSAPSRNIASTPMPLRAYSTRWMMSD